MQYISATDARAAFAEIIDNVQREPVVIRRQDRDVAVLISPREYDKLRGLRVNEFKEICRRAGEYAQAQGLTEEILADLLKDES